jgi:methyltransferase (TIGR00027 family)
LGKDTNTIVFELDSRFTQQAKLDLYRKNHIPVSANARFVSIDFNEESLDQKLAEIGAKKSQRTLFILEGLVMYLEPSAARTLFKTISEHMGQNSLIVFDYVYADVLRKEKGHYGETEVVKSVSGVHEHWRFGIEKDTIKEFLSENGLVLRDQMNGQNIEETYFKDDRGNVIAHVNDTQCFVLAEKI